MAKEKKYGDKTLCVCDQGLFVELAVRLAQDFGEVYYFNNFKNAFVGIEEGKVGENMDGIEKIRDFWEYKDLVDIFLFPDIMEGDLQQELRSQGKLVFGSGSTDKLELERWDLRQTLKKVGLPTISAVKVIGIDALREHLMNVQDKYVKVSYWRNITETFHHINYEVSRPILDKIAYKINGLDWDIEFIIEDELKGVEIGFDGYCVDGEYPYIATQGYEVKGMAYGCCVMPYEKLGKQVKEVNTKMAPIYKKNGYRGFYSTEIRVDKKGTGYFTDLCSRSGSPPNETYQQLFTNLADIVWEGAQGKCIAPTTDFKYGAELIMHSNWALKDKLAIQIPDEIKQWVKLRNCCRNPNTGTYYILPQPSESTNCGAIVGLGNSLDECFSKIEEYSKQIVSTEIDVNLEYLQKIKECVKEGEKLGLNFD